MTVEYDNVRYDVFPVVRQDGIPVLFSRTLRTGCYCTLMPGYQELLWDLLAVCEEKGDPEKLLGKVHEMCYEAIGDRWKTYHSQLGAEPRRCRI